MADVDGAGKMMQILLSIFGAILQCANITHTES